MFFLSDRRLVALGALTVAALALPACKDRHEGESRVVAIGVTPKMVDPARGALGAGDAILLANVAQGLVSFDAGGNIVPGLAERWTASEDGLSYIFRLAPAKWGDERKVTADQVAKALNRARAASGRNDLKDTLGAVDEIVAMTDKVLEIRLAAPRPNLLSLLAQPEFAILRSNEGTGPFFIGKKPAADGAMQLTRTIPADDDSEQSKERLTLAGAPAEKAISAFLQGKADLVLGGTMVDLPLAQRAKPPRDALRFDPVSGLFGLVPTQASGPFAKPEVRSLLNRAIGREAFATALAVPGLVARATLLEAGLDGIAAPQQPGWTAQTPEQRLPELQSEARRLFGDTEVPAVRVYLPEGAGSDILYRELQLDWGQLGLKIDRSRSPRDSDFALIDLAAPSQSPAWFVRRFRCSATPICDPQIDELLDQARASLVPAQRYALIGQAAALADEKVLFMPITAPVRWSLVSDRMAGFKTNRYARHTLTGLQQQQSGRE